MVRYLIGADTDGITDKSLKAIEAIKQDGRILERIEITGEQYSEVVCSFIFEDNSVYDASGFSIGYGGEGPSGLYKAIKLFHPEKIAHDFQSSAIPRLNIGIKWEWLPNEGFII